MEISWEAPAEPHHEPADYRVRWAKSDEDYPSSTEDDGNSYPAGTSLKLTGLDHGVEYKVQVRARYSDADEPWSGPWQEATATVSQPPDAPAAPSLMGTALSPEGHVTLLWLDPSDYSITSYQVLRGPDADSLAVIKDDTGSNGTSYTDTPAPQGQTYTYAVRARNAAGLSPISDTATVDVPAEELTVARHEDGERPLVSNLEQINRSGSTHIGTALGLILQLQNKNR